MGLHNCLTGNLKSLSSESHRLVKVTHHGEACEQGRQIGMIKNKYILHNIQRIVFRSIFLMATTNSLHMRIISELTLQGL